MRADTLPKLLRYDFERYGDRKIAMRVKDMGIWQKYTWKDYYEKVKDICLGLISLGVEREDKVCILGENKPEWYWAELAVQAAGGIVVGIFTDCIPSEVKYYVEHSDSKFVVAHDQEQVDKLLSIKKDLPLLKKVIYWDPKGLWGYKDSILMSLDEVLDLGRRYGKDHPGLLDETIDRGNFQDICVICYTSGTTGAPKGAMLSYRSLITRTEAWSEVDQWNEKEQYLSFLPPAWITEQAIGIAGQLLSGMEVNFPEKPETVQENIREIGPHQVFFGPRLWENLVSTIQAKITDASATRRFLYRLFLPVGYRRAEIHLSKKKLGPFWQALVGLAYWALFRPLRDQVGLSNIRNAYTAGAAVSPDILRYFHAIGVNIKQLYGGSEAGLATIHRHGDIKWETSGTVLPGVELKLSKDGEILVKSADIFEGYYKDPKATQEKVIDGWYHTEDFGHLDVDNHLVVIDRMADLKRLRGGRKFSPQYIEVRLRFCPYIRDALVLGGEERDFVTAVINIDLGNVGRWAEARRIPYTTFTDLSQKPEVINLIGEYVRQINESIPEWMRVKRFVNLHKEFDADESELTRTRKIRRTFVEDRYRDLIRALHGSQTDFTMDTPITYRDGRTGTLTTTIKITDLAGAKG